MQTPVGSLTRTVNDFGQDTSKRFAMGKVCFIIITDLGTSRDDHNLNTPQPERNENSPGLSIA